MLREAAGQLEIILNGVFLMSTRNGASERALVREAVEAVEAVAGKAGAGVLIGGLGIGYSLAEAVAADSVREVVVVESEPDVIEWGLTHFRPYNEDALRSPKATVTCGDFREYVAKCPDGRFDAVCVDIDNGPDWISKPGNDLVYSRSGLERLLAILRQGGSLAVWAARESGDFARRLAGVFGNVEVKAYPAERGPDDVVYLAHRVLTGVSLALPRARRPVYRPARLSRNARSQLRHPRRPGLTASADAGAGCAGLSTAFAATAFAACAARHRASISSLFTSRTCTGGPSGMRRQSRIRRLRSATASRTSCSVRMPSTVPASRSISLRRRSGVGRNSSGCTPSRRA